METLQLTKETPEIMYLGLTKYYEMDGTFIREYFITPRNADFFRTPKGALPGGAVVTEQYHGVFKRVVRAERKLIKVTLNYEIVDE